MIFTTLLSLAATGLSLTYAAPLIARDTAVITFNGAAGASYTLTVPLDGSDYPTNNALSISTVTSTFDVGDLCTLNTIDYPPALVEGPPGTWAVGPPQEVLSIKCSNGVTPPSNTITVQFNGANPQDGVFYTVTVPLDGTVVTTNNPLSISTIYTTYANLPQCNIVYIDYPAALVNIAANTWAVGPPQTVESIQCW